VMVTNTVILGALSHHHTWILWRLKSHSLFVNLTIRVEVCLIRKANLAARYLVILSPSSRCHSLRFVLNCKFRQHTENKSPCNGLSFCMLVSNIVIEIKMDQILHNFVRHLVVFSQHSWVKEFCPELVCLRSGKAIQYKIKSKKCVKSTSSRTMALGSTQPLTEMSTRNLPGDKGRPARKADLTYELIF
jgi:hypothetical protein